MKHICAVFVGITLVICSAQGAEYQFIKIVDTAGGVYSKILTPMINNVGTVAFVGTRDVGGVAFNGIYTEIPTTVIVDDSDGLLTSFGGLSISTNGLVAFDAFEAGQTDKGIYTRSVGDIDPLQTLLYDNSNQFSCLFSSSVNSAGVVVFRGETLSPIDDCDSIDTLPPEFIIPAGIYTGTGGATTRIADNSEGNPDGFIDVGFDPRINDSGTVVFTADMESGSEGVFTGNGGALKMIDQGDFFFGHSINCAGTVALVSSSSMGGRAISKGDGDSIPVTIVDGSGGLSEFRQPSINCDENIAFMARAENFGFDGLYVVSDGVVRKVIEVGGTLEGLRVDHISSSPAMLNDANQIAFQTILSDGERYVFVVDVTDSDGDGIANDVDTDDDNDGVLDAGDAFPLDPGESVDTDGDGTGNNADTDDDGDSILDMFETENDLDPLDPGDGLADRDGDGFSNAAEFRARTDIDDALSTPDDNVGAVQVILELLLNKDSE